MVVLTRFFSSIRNIAPLQSRNQSRREELANSVSHGLALKAFQRISHPFLSTGLYLLMGWLVFFATDSRLKFGHFAWHLFVIAGTVCHYFAVLWYAA